jgi:hypothetical protein
MFDASVHRVTMLVTWAVLAAPVARADVITEWDRIVCDAVAASKISTPIGVRAVAIAQTATFEAVNEITGRYASPGRAKASNASVDAAVAAANRAALMLLLPAQKEFIEAAYEKAVGRIQDGEAKSAGVAIGERTAADVVARRRDDGYDAPETYRPANRPGVYVPTTIPVVPQWPQRKPWLLASASQFRPAPPPALDSALWARDFIEIKALGARAGSTRTAEQTEVAKFWEATLPSVYHGIVRSVAEQPGREVTRNARLFAAVAQGMDDALIAVFDAKYHYGFWRPVTAVRNGDTDGNDATDRDPSWTPFIETPMHPEYPCAHCTLAATVGTILEADAKGEPLPELATTSYTLEGVTRRWKSVDELTQEVAAARVYDGVHFRNSTTVGTTMGRQVGERTAKAFYPADN